MTMFHLLKIRTSIDIFENEKCKVTFGLEYISKFLSHKSQYKTNIDKDCRVPIEFLFN